MGFEYRMSEEEFKDLVELLDPGNTNMVNCIDFLRLFDPPNSGKSECNASVHEDYSCSDEGDYLAIGEGVGDKYLNLTGKKLKSKMKHYINRNLLNLERAFLVCDPNQCGFISLKRLQDLLETYCFPVSDSQFKELIAPVKLYGDSLNYKEFMHRYKKMPNEDAAKWIATVKKLVSYKSKCPPALPVDEVEELLRECVHARKSAMLKDFMALDACNVGVICKSDVKCVLNKFCFRLSDKQFEELWKKFPRNKFNQLIYEVFLEEYSIIPSEESPAKKKEASPKVVHEPCTMHPEKPRQPQGPRKCAKELLFASVPVLKPLFEAMEPTIVRNYRTIRYHLQRADKKNSGIVKIGVLKVILLKSGIFLTNEDEFHLLEYFDPYLSGNINYRDFLRVFVWFA